MTTRVLLVDDDDALCQTLAIGLRKHHHHEVVTRTSAEEAYTLLMEDDFDVVVTDLNMRQVGGIELCERIVANRPDVPTIVLTAFGSLDTAVAAIRAGAYDFISKPVEIAVLAIAVDRAAAHRRLGQEVKRLQRESSGGSFDELIARSKAMKDVVELIDRVAASDVTVLVTGESGTGKEVVARALHRHGRRAGGPFIAINCAAMPEALLESELFGHTRGAFTDAKSNQSGLFVRAHRGTILLDEIGDMPLAIQPKLLRVLQERTVRPLGSNTEIPVDVRVITATNRDLETAIEEGLFREDLFYRINVVQLRLPPLRERGGDILSLAQHFVSDLARRAQKDVTGIAPAAAERLLAYDWPGNVRELQNCIERAIALTRFEQIGLDDLPEKVRDYHRSHVLVAADNPSELVPMDDVERRYVLRVMEAVNYNKTAAARILGFDRKRLYRWLERLGIDRGKSPG